MADHEFTITDLSIRVLTTGEGDERRMAATINFTRADRTTFKVVLASMLHHEVSQLLQQIDIALSTNPQVQRISDRDFTKTLLDPTP